MKYAIKEGNYAKMGTMVTLAGTIFTFEGEKEAECAVLLYQNWGGCADRSSEGVLRGRASLCPG